MMAHIKCRYYDYQCSLWNHVTCKDPLYGGGCKDFTDHFSDANKIYISEVCMNAYKSYVEFEKDCKRYEVDDFELWMPKRHISMDRIELLEIDGRVLVDGGEVE